MNAATGTHGTSGTSGTSGTPTGTSGPASAPSTPGARSGDPAVLEREASEIRADMDRTLQALERRFAPRELLDRSTAYLRLHGGKITRTLGDTVKQNPIPVLLTAAGLTWLIVSGRRARSGLEESGEYDYERSYDESYDYGASASRRGRGLKQKISEKLHQGAERLQHGADRLQERAASLRENWRSSRTSEHASERAHEAVGAARDRAIQTRERAQVMVDEQPLLLGVLAVVAGAVIGAALPTTQYERRTVGPVRDRTLDKAKEVGEREYEHLRSKLPGKEDVHVSGRAS